MHTLESLKSVKLPELKTIANGLGLTIDKVKEFGRATMRSSWISAILSAVKKTAQVTAKVLGDRATWVSLAVFLYLCTKYTIRAGENTRTYYDTIAPYTPLQRIGLLLRDTAYGIASLARALGGFLDRVDYDPARQMVKSSIVICGEVYGVIAFCAPIITGIIIYQLKEHGIRIFQNFQKNI